ncbi:MAG: hypothetical protein KBC30_02620 [Planctomycetes bacterium]|jgi:ABC-type transport system substrate-binding protein|nr:hypothetical protein [Planctomycetota bacterium]HPY74732.1 ABC transporter substrate-binding protein [Planctomycetota bacterium]HQA99739.1 ABC transporter substrate-binding protein [Planctomycetota bacterium]
MRFLIIFIIILLSMQSQAQEIIYAEMEFPLSFLTHLRQYKYNPLAKFQTEVEGRIIELTSDPLIDIYEIRAGQLAYRPCLANWRETTIADKEIINFNFTYAQWQNGRQLNFDDILFSLNYKKYNKDAWSSNLDIVLVPKGTQSFDAYIKNPQAPPLTLGEFNFPILNKDTFINSENPEVAAVNKSQQNDIGYGRYKITEVQDNRYIQMKRNPLHPYYRKLTYPENQSPVEVLRMQAFPKARINRNEQFVQGRVHLITSITQADRGYILNSFPDAKISAYSDDSFTMVTFNCYHPYLKLTPVRRALNYIFRKELALERALGGEGELISGPLPRRNFYYNLAIPPFEDSVPKAIATLQLYIKYGLDVYEHAGKLYVHSVMKPSPCQELEKRDQITRIEQDRVNTLEELLQVLDKQTTETYRVYIIRGQRILAKKINTKTFSQPHTLSTLRFVDQTIQNFPTLNLIANNPEGKNPLIKEVCGALKEDLEKIGIRLNIDYLDGKDYYPLLRASQFDLAFRTIKITGTPSLYRMFYKDTTKEQTDNTNYGSYYNEDINEIALRTQDETDIKKMKNDWKAAHEILHYDPPYLYLWSRRHIIVYNPMIQVTTPNPEYPIPYGQTNINGLINIFNEVHLWTIQK